MNGWLKISITKSGMFLISIV